MNKIFLDPLFINQ